MEDITVSDFVEEEARLTAIAQGGAYKLDDQLHVQFYKHAELNAAKSKEAGRKIFEEKIYVRIMAPANRLNIVERAATDEDKVRFERHFTRFMQGLEQLAVGTPIAELSAITMSQVLELKALKVETIEQLANLPDHTTQLLGLGGSELKRRAIAYIASRSGSEAIAQKTVELERQVAELTALLAERQKEEQQAKQQTPAFQVKPKA